MLGNITTQLTALIALEAKELLFYLCLFIIGNFQRYQFLFVLKQVKRIQSSTSYIEYVLLPILDHPKR